MWNNYFSGRPSRSLPQVNYKEQSSDEDEENPENFVSPGRPPVTRAGSPVELAIPHLNDNVDEDLERVSQTLRNVGHTRLFRPQFEEGDEESVISGHIVGAPVGGKVEADPPVVRMVNYDQQNEEDDAGAISNARDVRIPFNKNDIKLWFSLVESKMQFAGIKKQWSKRQVLVQIIPPDYHSDFRHFLQMQEDQAGNNAYFELKTAMIKQFGPKKADGFDKAINRVMTGLPSQLGRQILADICPSYTPLQGCHCSDTVLGIWRRSLPAVVRNAVADMDFNAATYKNVFDKADNVWASNAATTTVVSSLAKVAAASSGTSSGTETVAASGPPKKNKKNKGGGKKPKRGPRHSDNPPMNSCDTHFTYGKAAWFCADRHSCPWRDYENPKPKHNRNIAGAEMVEED